MPLPKQEPKKVGPTEAFAELEALRTAKERELRAGGTAQPFVPAVALQQFLVLLQAKKFEKAKALAFRSECDQARATPHLCRSYVAARSPRSLLPAQS